MLKVKNITKTFGNIIALDDVDFEIKKGEFVFLTGPSGSGKTTLLRLILRDLLPDEGDLLLNDKSIVGLGKREIPLLRQKIGTVFQDFKVLPERTVAENIEVALAVIGLPQDEWTERIEHVLHLVGLSSRINHFPAQLSGGELQRVSLARALVVNPEIILADEPTGNLDWDTAAELMDLFEKISDEGKTILMATHHRGIIDKLGKREIKLKQPQKRKIREEKALKRKKDKVSIKSKKIKKRKKDKVESGVNTNETVD